MAKQKKQSKKRNFDKQLRKYLSKESSDRIMAKIMGMVKAKKSPLEIQLAVVRMVAAECAPILPKALATGTSVRRMVRAGGPVQGSTPQKP